METVSFISVKLKNVEIFYIIKFHVLINDGFYSILILV